MNRMNGHVWEVFEDPEHHAHDVLEWTCTLCDQHIQFVTHFEIDPHANEDGSMPANARDYCERCIWADDVARLVRKGATVEEAIAAVLKMKQALADEE